ncbi:MAG: DNA topoisomerase I [Candidatus Schekmanbacteria bacterium GWA2_38_11]|uniref:DNA topoisomerase 1 n=1 Tax=Candidatus Schekmanbacteria bacterium GWA2_38_11 TaxID=1817876 RepID=A0A1F7RFN9_9BACT|nr:MAG: DNA topoisomerase I [Candidatus Schekmanbacteria bacterium GWA2_38_11]
MTKKSLVIVESPAKAKTINKLIGSSYTVKASVGHIKDLPKSKIGVEIENDFKPHYVVIKGKSKVVKELKEAAKKAKDIFLAPDPDREGEAIAWHIASELGGDKKKIYRVLFNEITKKALESAFKNPGEIDKNKVDAQQARRVLDRLVGYKISPLLWRRIGKGLSAGRVQSVALRLICEREREIKVFVKEEYWSITATLEGKNPPIFDARLIKVKGEKAEIKNTEVADKVVEELKRSEFSVQNIEKKERKRNPVPPFITSTLQQEAFRHFHFSATKTMVIAQQLYEGLNVGGEGVVGLITYMRTDSTRISTEAQSEARGLIAGRYGKEYLPDAAPVYSTGKNAQDAHEAIRPTYAEKVVEELKEYLNKDQLRLYQLIWQRFIASQMKPAILDSTVIDIKAGDYLLRVTGSVLKFDGFMRVYLEKKDEEKEAVEENGEYKKDVILPQLSVSEILKLHKLLPEQHFTEPPPRYSEATLIRELEKKGIGRPSTYAPIMAKIQDRKYTLKENGRFKPSELGFLVTDILVENFPDVLNVEFTATMEDQLDRIEEGKVNWVEIVKNFYQPFNQDLEKAQEKMEVKEEPTDIVCEKCGSFMMKKWGRNGFFLACPKYPECRNTKNFTQDENGSIIPVEEKTFGEKCEKCGGEMVIKVGRYGKFLACSNYPECKNTKQIVEDDEGAVEIKDTQILDELCPTCTKPLAVKKGRYGTFVACSGYPECRFIKPKGTGAFCPEKECGGELVERKSRKGLFYSCNNYPKCKFALWDKPINKSCPKCKSSFLVEKFSKKDGIKIKCISKSCDYEERPGE